MTHYAPYLARADLFGPCVTRRQTIAAIEHGALNLSQGFPEEEPPLAIREAAMKAISHGSNQYADMRGLPALREAIAIRYRTDYGMPWVDATQHVTVTCGATEAMAAAVLATVGVGDEVVIQEPTYENYPPQGMIAGAAVRYLTSVAPTWEITRGALEHAFSRRTRVLILNNPNNPTGRVYSREELELVAEFCQRFDALALVDEVYEHHVFDGSTHIRLATIPGMEPRTVTISSASKTYAVTGWRVGWVVAPQLLTAAIQRIHDFLTATVPTPLQAALVEALALPPEYHARQLASYRERRSLVLSALEDCGLDCAVPQGAYYVFPSCEGMEFSDSVAFADALIREGGVAVVPHTAFYRKGTDQVMRFRVNFAKSVPTLEQAAARLVAFCRRYRRPLRRR